jgi:predicted dehydrogenase
VAAPGAAPAAGRYVGAVTSDTPVRWGILATGKIAHTFARDLRRTPGAELVAVGSRRLASAEAFAAEHGGRPYGSYEELVADPEVDVVYIATPHALHLENARLVFEAGKHVLCEKPLTLSTADAEEMVALARRHDRFLMEAMWTACHPTIIALRRRLAAGEFGTPRHFHAELGFLVTADPGDRMVDPALGASALLDMGVYPLTVAHLLLGEAESLHAVGDTRTAPGGTFDTDVAIVGRYPGGVLATLTASITSWSSREAAIATDRGRILLDDFHHPSRAVFQPVAPVASWTEEQGAAEPVVIEPDGPVIGAGYGNEIAEVGRCLREGLRESPLVPHAQTLTLLRQMDDVRRQVGVEFT